MGRKKLGVIQINEEFRIPSDGEQPTDVLPPEDWPLLLKNYHKLNVRSDHFTTIDRFTTINHLTNLPHFTYHITNI